MACCAEDGDCPMHNRQSHDSDPRKGKVLTQVEADSCCLSAEQANSTSPSALTVVAPISAAVLGPGIVLPMSVPSLVLSDDWRTFAPLPTTPVPKHVLLSVFLV